MSTKICFISDSHSKHNKLIIPECDILVHAGDWTSLGEIHEVRNFGKWLDKQPAGEIVLVPGNHERIWERCLPESKEWLLNECPWANLLMESSIELNGLHFWGSGYTPAFGFQWAFNAGRTPVEAAHLFKPFIGDIWAQIPNNVNILVTHGMPYGILDDAMDFHLGKITSVGDRELLKRCQELKNLKVVVGGHLHAQGGKSLIRDGVTYINAAVLNDNYQYEGRAPIIVEI